MVGSSQDLCLQAELMGASGTFDPTANAFDNRVAPRRQGRERHGPSKGCESCRHRKIKCDEKRPVCSRCQIRGLGCEYRDYFLLVFRDETSSAANKVRRRVRVKQHDRGELALALSLRRPKPLLPPVQQRAIVRFFHDFVLDRPQAWRTPNPNGGYLSLIPEMYRQSKPHSSFALALSAAANANFWRRHNSFQAQSNSLKDCGKALQQLRKDMQRRRRFRTSADMMAASTLLAMYELVVTRDLSQRASLTAHINGAVALLESEDQSDPEIRKLAGILQPIVFQMIIDCLIMGRRPSLSLEKCTSLVPPVTPLANFLVFMYRTSQLGSTWKDHWSAVNDDPAQDCFDVGEFLEECQMLDEEIEDWVQSRSKILHVSIIENTEHNIPVPLRALFASSGAPKTLRLCATINHTHQWQFYRACRLTLLRCMMAAVDKALAVTTTDAAVAEYKLLRDRIHSRMIGLVDDLLSMVFSTLKVSIPGKPEPETAADIQGFRGLQLLWPLHTAGTSLISIGEEFPDGSEKFEWVRTLFRWIRDDLGIQTANSFLQNSRTYRPENLP